MRGSPRPGGGGGSWKAIVYGSGGVAIKIPMV